MEDGEGGRIKRITLPASVERAGADGDRSGVRRDPEAGARVTSHLRLEEGRRHARSLLVRGARPRHTPRRRRAPLAPNRRSRDKARSSKRRAALFGLVGRDDRLDVDPFPGLLARRGRRGEAPHDPSECGLERGMPLRDAADRERHLRNEGRRWLVGVQGDRQVRHSHAGLGVEQSSVVVPASFRICQHVVGLDDLLEDAQAVRPDPVRVISLDQLPEGLPNPAGALVRRYTEHQVIRLRLHDIPPLEKGGGLRLRAFAELPISSRTVPFGSPAKLAAHSQKRQQSARDEFPLVGPALGAERVAAAYSRRSPWKRRGSGKYSTVGWRRTGCG
jgi:hypothetical protein